MENEIIVKEYELPKLEIKDYEKILKAVEEENKMYDKYLVTESTLDTDIKKRAELRNNAKSINQRRLDIEKKISEPIKEFKTKCDVLIKMYEASADLIDTQIKVFETRTKNAKKELCVEIFNNNINELKDVLKFETLFNEKWLNKGTDIKDVEKEIKEKTSKINDDLKAIENLKSKYEIELKNDYLINFDLGKVIIKNNNLIESEEKLKKASEELETRKEIEKEIKIEEMITTPVEVKEEEKTQTYTLEITGTVSQQKLLKEFLDINNMSYKKI